MPKRKSKKEKEESKIFYLRASSIEDICRHVCRFDFSPDTLLLSENRLVAMGERIRETLLAYYSVTKEHKNIIMYEPATANGKERVEFTEKTDIANRYYINVMRADLHGFVAAKTLDKKAVQLIKVNSQIDLISAAIRKAAKDETIANIYSFKEGGKTVLAAFEVLEQFSNDKPILYYCVSESVVPENFARYDYRNNVLDFTDMIGDHAYMYAKIIHLNEAFPFFKREDK